MAKPFREGKGWAVRLRVRGEDVYLSGFPSAAAAEREARRQRTHMETVGAPARLGPRRTCLAQALQDYAREHLPLLKGAPQELRRINRYLREAGQDTLVVAPLAAARVPDARAPAVPGRQDARVVRWRVEQQPADAVRKVPSGLGPHRAAQAERTRESDRLRARLARMSVAQVSTHHVQQLIYALQRDGLSAASVALERAMLRGFFYHASEKWGWAEPARNPAVSLDMPAVDNARDRVLTKDEEPKLIQALEDCQNELVLPAVTLLKETAMRSSEVLATATWGDVLWSRRVLRLADAKAGSREVPLSPEAFATLQALPRGAAHERILAISYDALKAAWTRACERAGIQDLHLHDLRHTAATRFALEYGGNIFLLKALTGHKTLSQLQRYVNVKADDVVRIMHARSGQEWGAGTGPAQPEVKACVPPEPAQQTDAACAPTPRRSSGRPPAGVKRSGDFPQQGSGAVVIRVDFTRKVSA